jgi:hypothetical protein
MLQGGGIAIFAGSITLQNSTVHHNKAGVGDAGIRVKVLSPAVDHSQQDVLFMTLGSSIYDN